MCRRGREVKEEAPSGGKSDRRGIDNLRGRRGRGIHKHRVIMTDERKETRAVLCLQSSSISDVLLCECIDPSVLVPVSDVNAFAYCC